MTYNATFSKMRFLMDFEEEDIETHENLQYSLLGKILTEKPSNINAMF